MPQCMSVWVYDMDTDGMQVQFDCSAVSDVDNAVSPHMQQHKHTMHQTLRFKQAQLPCVSPAPHGTPSPLTYYEACGQQCDAHHDLPAASSSSSTLSTLDKITQRQP